MPKNPITVQLPNDLPTDWTYGKTVGPNGTDVGLTKQYGYNYLMQQVNAAQEAAKELGVAFEKLSGDDIPETAESEKSLSTALSNKADLKNGQVPYAQMPHLTSHQVIYVSPSGDDSNPGTQQAPFKTIQAAVDSLPKDMGKHTATIQVAEGEYPEDVVISGFYGGDISKSLLLKGADSIDESRHIKTLHFIGNTAIVQAVGFYVTGNKSGFSVAVDTSYAHIRFIKVKKLDDNARFGVDIGGWGGATADVQSLNIEGYPFGICVGNGSVVTVNSGSITGCDVGIKAGNDESQTNAIIMINNSVTLSGNTVDTAKFKASQIFTEV